MLIGLVGKPNTGKSTLFKALTLAEVAIAAYPFTTIEPNRGFGHVRVDCAESFFKTKCNPRFGYCVNGKRFVPVELIDVAGLVPGAYAGKGLGNLFLDHLRQADALIHVVDASGGTNERGEIVPPGSYEPGRDIAFLEHELSMWWLGILKRGWERGIKQLQAGLKLETVIAKQLSGLKVSEELVKAALKKLELDPGQAPGWADDVLLALVGELRARTQPLVIAANKLDVPIAEANLAALKAAFPDRLIIGCSAEAELALKEACRQGLVDYIPGDPDFRVLRKPNEKQTAALGFIKSSVLQRFGSTGVQALLNSVVFEVLGQIAVWPVASSKLTDKEGRVLPDCLLLSGKSTAEELAYAVHTELGRAFVRAIDQKSKKVVGREHVLKNGDVLEIVTSH